MVNWADKSDQELVDEVGRGPGGEPAARWQGLVESNRRVIAAVNELRNETAHSSRTMEKLTWWLVALTVVLVLVGVATVLVALTANGS